jgi:uncharacterized membrane protein
MARIRTRRERLLQTIWFEGMGLVLITPLCSMLATEPFGESCALLMSLSIVVMIGSATFNNVFDRLELAITGRRASERPHGLRVAHAVLHEASATLLTCPVIFAWTGLHWREALVADIGLATAYAAYGYAFHWTYDRLRPLT